MDRGCYISAAQSGPYEISFRQFDYVKVIAMQNIVGDGQALRGRRKMHVIETGKLAAPLQKDWQVPELDAQNRRLEFVQP